MSYDIVKNLSVVQDFDGSFYAKMKSASNNVYPHYYNEWNYGKGQQLTKEQLEKDILLDFYHGNLQKGTSKYKRAVDSIEISRPELLQKAYRINRVADKVRNTAWKYSNLRYKIRESLKVVTDEEQVNKLKEEYDRYDKLSNERHELHKKIYSKYEDEVKETLYLYLYLKNSDKKTVKGIVMKRKNTYGDVYADKITSRHVMHTYKRKVITNLDQVKRVLCYDREGWYKDRYEIEVVY